MKDILFFARNVFIGISLGWTIMTIIWLILALIFPPNFCAG